MAARMTNFSQIALSMSSETTTSIPSTVSAPATCFEALAAATTGLAQLDLGEATHLADPPRSGDGGRDEDHATQDPRSTERLDRHAYGLDTILQWNHRRLVPDDGCNRFQGALQVTHLHSEKDEIHGPGRPRIGDRTDIFEHQIPARAFDVQALITNSLQMGAAGDEGHIPPGREHPTTEISADTARTDHQDAHCLLPLEPRNKAVRTRRLADLRDK